MTRRTDYDWVVLWSHDLECMVVVPDDDLAEHRTGDVHCCCEPTWADNVLVHHAGDGRPQFRRLAA